MRIKLKSGEVVNAILDVNEETACYLNIETDDFETIKSDEFEIVEEEDEIVDFDDDDDDEVDNDQAVCAPPETFYSLIKDISGKMKSLNIEFK
jgi:hypothetical protein